LSFLSLGISLGLHLASSTGPLQLHFLSHMLDLNFGGKVKYAGKKTEQEKAWG